MSRSTFVSAWFFLGVISCGGQEAASPPPDTPRVETTAEAAPIPEHKKTEPAAGGEAAPGEAPKDEVKEEKKKPGAAAEAAATGTKMSSDVPGANLTVGEVETDGLRAKDIVCKTEGNSAMALLGVVLVTAWMAPQKDALDACAPAGTETRVSWKARGGKVSEVKASGSPKTKACVERALSSGKPVLEGHCAATVILGKK